MGISLNQIRRVVHPERMYNPTDDFRILDSWTEYDDDNVGINPSDRQLEFLCYEIEVMNPETGKRQKLYKAIKFARTQRVSASLRQSTSLMDMMSQLLTGLWASNTNLIVMIANVIKPEPLGVLFLYGTQATGLTIDEAKEGCELTFQGLIDSIKGSFKTVQLRGLNAKEMEWLREKMYHMEFMTAVRGIPKANPQGEDLGNKGFGKANINPDSHGTLEEMIVGMSDHEYVIEILSTRVNQRTLEGWQRQTQRDMTLWNEQLQGQKGISANISLPIMYTANASQSEGWSKAYTDADSVNYGTSENYGQTVGQSVGEALSQTYAESLSYSQGQSVTNGYTHGITEGQSLTLGQTAGQTVGTGASLSTSSGNSLGLSYNQNDGISNNFSSSQSTNVGQGQSLNTTQGHSEGSSYGLNQGQSASSSHSIGSSESLGYNQSNTVSLSNNASISETAGWGANRGYTHTAGTTEGSGLNIGGSVNFGSSGSQSETNGASGGFSVNVGVGGGVNTNHSDTTTVGFTAGQGANASLNSSASLSKSDSLTAGSSINYSNGVTQSEGITQGQSAGTSQTFGASENYGTTVGNSIGQSWGSSASDSISYGTGQSINISNGASNSYGAGKTSSVGQGLSYNANDSQSIGQTLNQSQSLSSSISQGQSVSESQSVSQSYGNTVSESAGKTSSQGYSQNVGSSESVTQGRGTSTSKGTSTSTSSGSTGGMAIGTGSSMGFVASIGYNKSHQWLNQEVKDLLEILEYQNERLKMGTNAGRGAFYTYVYIGCPTKKALAAAKAVAHTSWHNSDAKTQPLQVLNLSEHEQKHLLYHFAAFSADITRERVFGVDEFKYCTVLFPNEFAAYTHLPRMNVGGIETIAQDIPKFTVPAQMQGDIFMGYVVNPEVYSYKTGNISPNKYRMDESMLMHGYVTGTSRSGKTVTAMRFISELAQIRRKDTGKRLRIVVMDPKQDWRALARFVEPERFKFFSMGNTKFHPIKLNPWKIPLGVDPQQWIDTVIGIYCRAYGFLERGKQMIAQVVFGLYDEAGIFPKDTQEGDGLTREEITELSAYVCFDKIYKKFAEKRDELIGAGRAGNDTKDAYERILERLSCFSRPYSIEYKLYGTEEGQSIDELIGGDDVTVLESKGLEDTFKNFIFGAITSGFFRYAISNDGGFKAENQYETVLVIEEANEVLTGNDKAGKGSDSVSLPGPSEFELILDQAAGYGLFIFAITQKIADMPRSVLANAGINFIGRIAPEEDKNVAIHAMARESRIDDRDLVTWLPRQPIGWFICRTSRAFNFLDSEPVLVAISALNVKTPSNLELDDILARKEAILLARKIAKHRKIIDMPEDDNGTPDD